MNVLKFRIYFHGLSTTPEIVTAFTKDEAIILAQAERIKFNVGYQVKRVEYWNELAEAWQELS
jgi:hypothetical protein